MLSFEILPRKQMLLYLFIKRALDIFFVRIEGVVDTSLDQDEAVVTGLVDLYNSFS